MGLPRPNYDNLVSYLTVWSLAGKWEKELKTYIDVYENIINFNVIMVSIHKDWYLIVYFEYISLEIYIVRKIQIV